MMSSFLPGTRIRATVRAASAVDYPPGATFGPRTLTDFELVWLLRGSARWNCGLRELELVPGSLLLIRPGMRDEFHWDRERVTTHAYAHFTIDGPPSPPESWPLVRNLVHDDPLAGLFRYLLWLRGAEPRNWRPRAAEVVGLLVATFVGGPLPETGDVAPIPTAVEAVVEHVRRQWTRDGARPVSLAELASAASLSTVHLSRLFRSRFGVGPVSAFEMLRLRRAEGLLLRSNLPISTIARECGFADQYHFSRRFRAAYGVAPRGFRQAGPESAPPSPVVAAGLLPLERRLWGSAPPGDPAGTPGR